MVYRTTQRKFAFAVTLACCTFALYSGCVFNVGSFAKSAPRSKHFNEWRASSNCQCPQIRSTTSWTGNANDVWCSREATSMGRNQSVVTYSVYGDALDAQGNVTKYYNLLSVIAQQVKHFYPSWRIRFYHSIDHKQQAERRLLCQTYCENDHVDLCDINDVVRRLSRQNEAATTPVSAVQLKNLNRMLWRYLPMLDPQVDRMMVRDTDSELSDREAVAVGQWLASPATFHVMRDHQNHCNPRHKILGGMFGAKTRQRRDVIDSLIRVIVNFGWGQDVWGRDQKLLTAVLWPTVKDDAMIHDSYCCEKSWNSVAATPFPTQRVAGNFVADRNDSAWTKPQQCPLKCRPPEHPDWDYC